QSGGCKVQPTAGRQIEATLQHASDHDGTQPGSQGLLDCPERALIVARFNQHKPAGINPETIKTMTIRSAPFSEGPLRGHQDSETRLSLQCQRHQGEQEAQGCRCISVGGGNHLVQHAAGKTGSGKMPLDLGYTEGKKSWRSPEERSFQFCDDVPKSCNLC